MKIHVEVDCTPEEARRAMGLPDLTPVHDRYVQLMVQAIETQGTPEAFETLVRSWTPMGEAGMNFWRTMFEGGNKAG
ncbi:DUF6489 family protein [Sphingomonas sp. S2-65]|jgi:hypothetical protein|uniref:DUF6489 family protein n=1 Tax=Sphingomonas sp. S2-65 TaxID=2903960 RepID=UPI001F2A36E5|nr:DUF6489 family protein [Sphingomonas sp. S2-65]UYY57323.1 DUF6489 family protein [Sphingomonas sp. S2-65]